jgi:uncharacterized protein
MRRLARIHRFLPFTQQFMYLGERIFLRLLHFWGRPRSHVMIEAAKTISRKEIFMLKVNQRFIDLLSSHAETTTIKDVRIGLGYTAVQHESGYAGVAWTPEESAPSCTHFKAAGSLAGSPARELLALLANETSGLARAVGLATANAILAALPRPAGIKEEVIASLNITDADHVAMVGFFGPIINSLKKTGCRLDIIELNPERGENTLTPLQGKEALASCTVAIITGVTLINNTFDTVTEALGNPRAAVLLGPSSPLCGEIFHGTKISHVAGSRVINADAVLRIVSEGGGTMIMKPYLKFETVLTGAR